jgi:hypothetical protein
LWENVVPNEDLVEVKDRWDSILGIKGKEHNALYSGNEASRERMYWTDFTDVTALPVIRNNVPGWALDHDYDFELRPVACLMSYDRTQRKSYKIQFRTGLRELLSPDDRDRINPGMKAGCSTGYGTEVLTDEERNGVNGNAFCGDAIWAILREIKGRRSVPTSRVATNEWYATAYHDPDKVERFLMQLEGPFGREKAIYEHLKKLAIRKGYMTEADSKMTDMPLVHLVLDDNQTIPATISHEGDVPAKLTVPAAYCIELMKRAGTHRAPENGYDPMMWVALMFFQAKDRFVTAEFDDPMQNRGWWKKGDQVLAVRPLNDRRPINNAASKSIPLQWGEHSPNRLTASQTIPHDTTHFKGADAKDAYHACGLSLTTILYSVAKCRLGRLYKILLEATCGT